MQAESLQHEEMNGLEISWRYRGSCCFWSVHDSFFFKTWAFEIYALPCLIRENTISPFSLSGRFRTLDFFDDSSRARFEELDLLVGSSNLSNPFFKSSSRGRIFENIFFSKSSSRYPRWWINPDARRPESLFAIGSRGPWLRLLVPWFPCGIWTYRIPLHGIIHVALGISGDIVLCLTQT